MNFLKTIRSNMRAGDAGADSPDAGPADADQSLPDGYTKLNERQAVAELRRFSQAELSAIHAFERSHRDRELVHDKLRYLRQPEPFPGYDALDSNAITAALATADADTIKAVRGYERKHQNRPGVYKEATSAIRRLRDDAAPAAAPTPAPVPDYEQPPVVGNGLPIKVVPETGLGTP